MTSVVYFVRIGKFIKIGVTKDLERRLSEFLNSTPTLELLAAIPGDRGVEHRIHRHLAELRVTREMFHRDARIIEFIRQFERDGLPAALDYLAATDRIAIAARADAERTNRVKLARKTRAEKDAYFASLVAERKQRLGW